MGSGIEVIARGVWLAQGRILLCRNVAKGYYYLPGGHVEPGETAAAALARELLEETGERPTIGQGLAIAECVFEQGGRTRHEINLVFHVEQQGAAVPVGSLEPDIAFTWAPLSDLSSLDFRPRVIRTWLESAGLPGLTGRAPSGFRWLSEV